MASKGRTPLSDLEKAKRKAARDYRKIAEMKALTYDDIYGKRAGNKNMGRKPVSKEEQIRRAKAAFLKSLSEHRAEARKESIDLGSIRDLFREYKTYRANDSAGRKAADRVIVLYKYIDKERAKLDQTISEPCPLETYTGRGRKPMSKEEKLQHYQTKIREAELEISELIANAPESQKIYYDLRAARLEVRSLKKNKERHPHDEMILHYLEEAIDKVAEIEAKYNEQLKIEKKEAKAAALPNSAATLPNSATTLPNSATALAKENIVDLKTNDTTSPHDQIEALKQHQNEIDEELAILEQLEETLRKKAELIQRKKQIQINIEETQRKLI